MADPLSILAIGTLAYFGHKFSKNEQSTYQEEKPVSKPEMKIINDIPKESLLRIPPNKTEVIPFSDVAPQQRTNGNEILEMRNRMYDAGRMNNLSPVEKQLVGPGLNVGPNVDSFGGYQQLYRVNPVNTGEYRLTTLPGRINHSHDINGGKRGIIGEFAQNRPEKTAFLPSRRPQNIGGRAQGMSGVVPRGEHEKAKRTTNRSQTGSRNDGLGFNAAKSIISGLTLAQDPTRNKKDGNIEQYEYNNQPQPNINKYSHGYLQSPAVQISKYTNDELIKMGFRPEDKRGNANRAGNAGRMNVRADPLNQGGMLTAVRSDTTRIDGRTNGVNGGWTQQYTNNAYHQLNVYKGNENPRASCNSLTIAKRQLDKNPLAHTIN